jgi:two-component system sensor histidine kinase CreC
MKIRTRIFMVFAIMIAAGIYSLVHWMQGEMKPRYMEAQEDTLVDISQLLASMISSQAVTKTDDQIKIDTQFIRTSFLELAQRNIDAQIYEIHKQQVDIRVYVTDINGIVVFDSHNDRDIGADYSQWRDVHRTLTGEYGARSTELDPLYPEGSIMYIAAPILFGNEIIGVVSVGKPTRNAERFMEHLLNSISSVSLVIVIITLLIGLIIHNWLSRPLSRIQSYAEAVTKGERTSLPDLGNNEIGEVGQALESMRIALDGKSYVSDYVQSLTHELKSPIAAIRGASELLNENMPDEDRERFLGNIKNESQRMQELVDRLLELASLEYRPGLDEIETISINELLNDVVDSLLPVAHGRQVAITITEDNNCQINGNYFLLSKALSNMLKNAIEFSPSHGEITVSVDKQQDRVFINICDQGKGIPDYAREKIFERFYSLPRPDGRKGSGLGLSFVKEIASLHRASVVVTDNPQATDTSGSCVKLVLPTIQHSPSAN